MSELVGVIGDTGQGKSFSMRNLDPDTTVVVGVWNKPLSFAGWKSKFTPFTGDKGNFMIAKKGAVLPYKVIHQVLKDVDEKRKEIKVVVIDDFQYLMAGEFMDKIEIKGWDKYNEMAGNVYGLLKTCASLRDDLTIVIMGHDETIYGEDGTQIRKMKTIGKLLDQKITLEGLFTVIFFTDMKVDRLTDSVTFGFRTQTDGIVRAKSPAGMFKKFEPNDLAYLLGKMENYYVNGVTEDVVTA